MTRIKYSKHGDSLVTDFFTVGPNNIIKGLVNSDFSYSIHTFDADIIAAGKASNLRNAKLAIKKLLVIHGVKFDQEIRNR